MMRVSPPELAREFPGPQASTRVTFAPLRKSSSAVHPPKAPAPTTITERRVGRGNMPRPRTQAAPVKAEPFKKRRRELFFFTRPSLGQSAKLGIVTDFSSAAHSGDSRIRGRGSNFSLTLFGPALEDAQTVEGFAKRASTNAAGLGFSDYHGRSSGPSTSMT